MVALHLASFSPDEHLGVLLGPGFVRASYAWHVTDPAAWAIVAEMQGSVVGLLGMCDGPFTSRVLRSCLGSFIASLLRRPGLLFDRRLWSRLVREKPSAPWVGRFSAELGVAQMTIGAVDSGTRGVSVFPSLIRECERLGQVRGLRAVRAGVYRGNLPCQRSFAKCGWTEVEALGSVDTVYFVRVFDPHLLEMFPGLSQAGVTCEGE